jgi:hypothetical protein
VSNTRRTPEELVETYPTIDGLVLCARFFRTYRRVTPDGFEDNFALFYPSRLLLSYGLRSSFENAGGAVVVNVSGPGHDTPIDWDDLQSSRNYDGVRAMFMTGRFKRPARSHVRRAPRQRRQAQVRAVPSGDDLDGLRR